MSSEYDAFTALVDRVLAAPHSEIQKASRLTARKLRGIRTVAARNQNGDGASRAGCHMLATPSVGPRPAFERSKPCSKLGLRFVRNRYSIRITPQPPSNETARSFETNTN